MKPSNTLSLARDGAEIREQYLPEVACSILLEELHAYAANHDLPLIERADGERALRYRVIDGDTIYGSLPNVVSLYDKLLSVVQESDSRLQPLSNRTACLNVNILPPGGEYRWHYDRNSVTGILFLNEVTGGELEMYPNFRIHLGRSKDSAIQRALDRGLRHLSRFGRLIEVAPLRGRMVLMRGDRCLHSVRRVEGNNERISIVMAFDLPGATFRAAEELDSYLYSKRGISSFDPNYRR